MGTVNKQIADAIIAGKYEKDNIIKIIKYTNAWGGESYGILTPRDRPDYYSESEYVRNPTVYWERNPNDETESNMSTPLCDHTRVESWWEYDAQDVPLVRVCKKCRASQLSRFRREILTRYDQADVAEPIEEE